MISEFFMLFYRFFGGRILAYTIRPVMLKYSDNRSFTRAVLNLAITEVIMENFKLIGEWLEEKGLHLKPTFSCALRNICIEFKKTTA